MLIQHPEITDYTARYAGASFRPLRVSAVMSKPIIGYHALHLDSLLSAAMVGIATEGNGVPIAQGVYDMPLPLECLWRDERGIPLWASTDFAPVGHVVKSQIYYHRRALEPHMTTKNIHTGKGRHKEKRTPFPTLEARILSADCIGNVDFIAELLATLTSLGKKRNTLGSVEEWRIDEIETFDLFDEGQPRRPIPIEFQRGDGNNIAYVAFSPPYWHPLTRTYCLIST